MRALPLFALALLAWAPLPAVEPAIVRGPSTLVYPDFWHTPMGVHRGTPRLLRLFLGKQARFEEPQGMACVRMKENGSESPQLTVFGVNSGLGQLIYNPDMASLAVYGSRGQGEGQFERPMGVAAMADGRVAVADSGNHRVCLLRYRHGRLEWQMAMGSRGKAPGQFESPSWLAYDSQGRLYVSDTGNHRVQVFSPEGYFLFEFGSDPLANNSLIEPQAIAVVDPQEPFAAFPLGAIFVVDQYHGRIQKFDLRGRFLGAIQARDIDRLLVYFSGLALDYHQNLWVAERGGHQLLKFDQYLELLDVWGGEGRGDYQLDSPRGLAIYRHYGQVFVSERQSAQYLWIGADVRDVRVSRAVDADGKAKMRVDYKLTEGAKTEVWIESAQGARLATLMTPHRLKQGQQTLFWDGITGDGSKIAPGMYHLLFDAEAGYSSATYFKKRAKKRFWVR